MPLYDYEFDDGERVERFFDMGTAPATITEDGRTARRAWGAQVQAARWSTGLESVGMGVHPDQVPREREFDRKHGLSTEYRGGNPVFRSRGERKRYMKARGFFDRDGGIGDAT